MSSSSHVRSASAATGHVTGKSGRAGGASGASAIESSIRTSGCDRPGLEEVPAITREGGFDVDRRFEGLLHTDAKLDQGVKHRIREDRTRRWIDGLCETDVGGDQPLAFVAGRERHD